MSRRPPDPPQLPLDFDADEDRVNADAGKSVSSKVVRLPAGWLRLTKRKQPEDSVDSVLDEVLSNAKRLNW